MVFVPSVALVNQCSMLSDEDVSRILLPLQTQVTEHVAPVWRIDAKLSFVGTGKPIPPGAWRLFLMDTTDDAGGDTGYHNTDSDGPFGRVFVKTAYQDQQNWTIVTSHELLEMLINPFANLAAFVPNDDQGQTGVYYDLEICDPVYPDSLAYDIGGTKVSDFVFPSWFSPYVAQPDPSKPSGQVDFARRLDGPVKLGPGGMAAYCGVGRQTWWSDQAAGALLPAGGSHPSPRPRKPSTLTFRRSGASQ
jgi:hypothetical protein